MSEAAANGRGAVRALLHSAIVLIGAVAFTLAFFLVLPLIQAISRPPGSDVVTRAMDTANLPPPPPPAPEEPEEEEPEEEEPPELTEEVPPLDLSQLELALDPGFSEGWMTGDFGIDLETIVSGRKSSESLFSMADLDQPPRVVYQPSPVMSAKMRRRLPGTVNVLFIVDEQGRVEKPMVESSTDPVFERAALRAVEKWRFEPGKRGGKPVPFRMRRSIVFPEA